MIVEAAAEEKSALRAATVVPADPKLILPVFVPMLSPGGEPDEATVAIVPVPPRATRFNPVDTMVAEDPRGMVTLLPFWGQGKHVVK